MNKDQIAFIKSLDPDNSDGTIQQVMLQKNLNEIVFEKALIMLVRGLMQDKKSLQHENKYMAAALKRLGEYNAQNIGLDV